VYAGGTELLLAMRHGALRYRHLVDVKVILPCDAIGVHDGFLEIGAGATHHRIERSPVVREKLPVLAEMESRVANVRVRASGTLGGNLCFAEPHSDPATLLLALGATVRAESASGSREMRVDELIEGAYANSLQPGELLMAIRVPCATPGQRAAYLKFQVHERPTLGLALVMETPDGGATISEARLAVGCVCPFPRRSSAAEKLLVGPRADVQGRLPQAAEALAADAELIDDHEGGADYKRHLIEVFLRRAFIKALAE
ncbi:MAG TPA: FAD binding domain-containing protein, partial [Bryobacteraceae bacterium]|nr:FAD binding domain-containing protein [Bryobacteraceae bacterium]